MPALQWKTFTWYAIFVFAGWAVCSVSGEESLRRIRPGQVMPSFSVVDANGKIFTYGPSDTRVLGLIVVKAGQGQFGRMMGDIGTVVKELRSSGRAFDCVGVISGPGAADFLETEKARLPASLPILLDTDFALWGKLGIIAAPTAMVVGADRKVRWAKAGYGYDFVPGFHAQLAKALGLQTEAEASVHVETLKNASNHARMERHLHMARTLAKKGRSKLAVAELEKARMLDPNAVDVVFELGELLCRTGESEAALKIAAQATVKTDADKARVLLISGWANRQMGKLDAAESLLEQAVELEPKSPRILYELGKIYQAGGDLEKAVSWYRQALAQVFDEPEKGASSRD